MFFFRWRGEGGMFACALSQLVESGWGSVPSRGQVSHGVCAQVPWACLMGVVLVHTTNRCAVLCQFVCVSCRLCSLTTPTAMTVEVTLQSSLSSPLSSSRCASVCVYQCVFLGGETEGTDTSIPWLAHVCVSAWPGARRGRGVCEDNTKPAASWHDQQHPAGLHCARAPPVLLLVARDPSH